MRSKNLRVFYFGGPGDIIGTYRFWEKGEEDPREVSLTYSGQFYNVCKKLSARAYAISSYPKKESIKNEQFAIKNIQLPFKNSKCGLLYWLGQLYYGMIIIVRAISFKADFAVINNEFALFSMLLPLSLCGIKVIPEFHNMLWRDYNRLGSAKRLIWKLNIAFFEKQAFAILCASDAIANQIHQAAKKEFKKVKLFLSTYRREYFSGIEKPDINKRPFRVLFAGRIEENKGVFDLLSIAADFKKEAVSDIVFDICGGGSRLETLKKKALELGLESTFICYGLLRRDEMKERINKSHIFIVPTRSSFLEGFNRVVVEGVLSGRPVITSSISYSLYYVKDAIAEVAPDDTVGYKDAVWRLYKDKKLYEEKRTACFKYQEQFYDEKNSEESALEKIFRDGSV